jgi:hypothetical protein
MLKKGELYKTKLHSKNVWEKVFFFDSYWSSWGGNYKFVILLALPPLLWIVIHLVVHSLSLGTKDASFMHYPSLCHLSIRTWTKRKKLETTPLFHLDFHLLSTKKPIKINREIG